MSLTLDRAIEIARMAHAGQLDKNGVTPYIEHPLAVMAKVNGTDAKIVAALHDCLEDSDLTLVDLVREGATIEQTDALFAITRRSGEPYRQYVMRALANPLARQVKIADYLHNSNEVRLARLPSRLANRLRQKYAGVADLIAIAITTES